MHHQPRITDSPNISSGYNPTLNAAAAGGSGNSVLLFVDDQRLPAVRGGVTAWVELAP